MRALILALAAMSIAAPAMAIVAHIVLPAPSHGVDYVDARCEGGPDGRLELVRVQADGKLLRMTRAGGLLSGSASRAEARRIMQALDRSGFGQRIVPRVTGSIPNALNCTMIRGGHGRLDVLALPQAVRTKREMRDVFRILDDVRTLGRRATRSVIALPDGRTK